MQVVALENSFPLLHDPPDQDYKNSCICRIPIIGWIIYGALEGEAHRELVNQAVKRGPVSESEWAPYAYNEATRRAIEKIVIRHAYPKASTFHPLDRIELMFVLRYGDLNEVQILMDVEDKFGIEIDETFGNRLIEERTTFIDFIRMIEYRVVHHEE